MDEFSRIVTHPDLTRALDGAPSEGEASSGSFLPRMLDAIQEFFSPNDPEFSSAIPLYYGMEQRDRELKELARMFPAETPIHPC